MLVFLFTVPVQRLRDSSEGRIQCGIEQDYNISCKRQWLATSATLIHLSRMIMETFYYFFLKINARISEGGRESNRDDGRRPTNLFLITTSMWSMRH